MKQQRMQSTLATPHPALWLLWGLAVLYPQTGFEWATGVVGPIAIFWGAIGYFLRWYSYQRCLLWRNWLLVSAWALVVWCAHCAATGKFALSAIAVFTVFGFFNRNDRDTKYRNSAMAANFLSRVLG